VLVQVGYYMLVQIGHVLVQVGQYMLVQIGRVSVQVGSYMLMQIGHRLEGGSCLPCLEDVGGGGSGQRWWRWRRSPTPWYCGTNVP
jgi:hypothetical protein